ncbi:MAG: glutaredoxin domain-containing protein [Chloroflexota bacterium]
MSTDKELVMYSRSYGCPWISIAKRVLGRHDIPYRELMIDKDPTAKERVLEWTGFLSVPTMVIANAGEDLPYTDYEPLPQGASPRGIDRGPMLTEATDEQVEAWLAKHGFVE